MTTNDKAYLLKVEQDDGLLISRHIVIAPNPIRAKEQYKRWFTSKNPKAMAGWYGGDNLVISGILTDFVAKAEDDLFGVASF